MFRTHTLSIADIHLGSPVNRAKVLVEVLHEWEYETLLIVGDLFDDHPTRLRKDDWKLLSYLGKVAGHKRVVWTIGNHDDDEVAEVVAHLLGIELVDEFEWEIGGKKYIALHGHQFDSFIKKHLHTTNMACAIYYTLQLLDTKAHRPSRFIKRVSKKWLKLDKEVMDGALAYCKEKGKDSILCGHTHMYHAHKDGVYYNVGCWTDIPSELVAVSAEGVRVFEVGAHGKCRVAYTWLWAAGRNN
jgi:UDP-2,3-diacylglucosamine pyrophosphatase LpxH